MRGFVLLCIGIFSSFAIHAQDALYNITVSSPLTLNPAFAGSANRRTTFFNRIIITNQYDFFQKRRNYLLSYDAFHHALGGAIGFYANKQSFGDIQLYSANGIYNYFIPVSKTLLIKTAIQIGYETKSIDQYSFIRRSEFPNYINTINPELYDGVFNGKPIHDFKTYMTFGAGSIAQWHQLEIGVSTFNINRPNWSFVKDEIHKKPVHFTIHVQHPLYLHEKYHLLAKVLYSNQSKEDYFVAGTQLKSNHFMFGLFYQNYRNHYIQYQIAETSLGYSFKGFHTRIGVKQNLNEHINYKKFNTSFSLLYIFNTSSVRVCRPAHRGEKFPDNTF